MDFTQIASAWQRSSLNDNHSDLSKRTLYNHCQAVAKQFGVEIACRRGRGLNRYYIANPETIDDNTLNKWALDSFALSSLLLENADISDKILIEDIPSSKSYLQTVLKSLKDNVCLIVSYCNFVGKHFDNIIVEPLCVKLFKRRWYLLGQIPSIGQKKIFCLDRITNLELTNKSFCYPKDFSASDFFESYFGIIAITDGKRERIKLRAYDELPGYLRSLPIHHSQREVNREGRFSDFEVELIPTFDFIQEILSHRDQLEIVAPTWLRREISDLINRMSNRYNDCQS